MKKRTENDVQRLRYFPSVVVDSVFINVVVVNGQSVVSELSPLSCVIRRSRGRNYEAELQKCRPEAILVEFGEYHPLKPIMVNITVAPSTISGGWVRVKRPTSFSAPVR